jgi:hypothetical protein
MAKYNLNIISLDVPFPPNYGGVIDIFFKIKALHEQGVNIYLHCFEYGRAERNELNKYCKKVFYYKRKTGIFSNFSLIPYIICSRRSKKLLDNLNSNNYPILFEGLHSTYSLLKNKFEDRILLLRSHNIEHDYYKQLAIREKNPFKKIYFHKEAFLLKRILKKLPPHIQVGAISLGDRDYFNEFFKNTFWLPPFHSNQKIESSEGYGNYVLYHGNLSVSENIEVAEYLIKQFTGKKVDLIIAGKEPSMKLIKSTEGINNIRIIVSPNHEVMQDLIKGAHVILLPTYQATGIKLKLIESLYMGRFCIANHTMINSTMLENLVIITENDFYTKAEALMNTAFSEIEISKRSIELGKYYCNSKNAKMILDRI